MQFRLSVRGASDIIRAIAAGANLDEQRIAVAADMLGHTRLDTVRAYTG